MSKFITPQDYDASIHREILDALTRNDNAIIEICEDRAISEMRGYSVHDMTLTPYSRPKARPAMSLY